MQIKGCERLTEANVIIAYELSSENAKVKTQFHNALYGRKKEGLLFKIPHRKLARGVIEIPQRNLDDIKRVFDKFGVGYELRLTLPVRDSAQIITITKTIEDPYEKAKQFDSFDFGEFVVSKLEEIGKGLGEIENISDEVLSLEDTMEKWVKINRGKALAPEFAYMLDALGTGENKSPEEVKRNALRIANSLRHWIVGYKVLEESKDNESIDAVLKKYRAAKKGS
jgi:hypothetical protein